MTTKDPKFLASFLTDIKTATLLLQQFAHDAEITEFVAILYFRLFEPGEEPGREHLDASDLFDRTIILQVWQDRQGLSADLLMARILEMHGLLRTIANDTVHLNPNVFASIPIKDATGKTATVSVKIPVQLVHKSEWLDHLYLMTSLVEHRLAMALAQDQDTSRYTPIKNIATILEDFSVVGVRVRQDGTPSDLADVRRRDYSAQRLRFESLPLNHAGEGKDRDKPPIAPKAPAQVTEVVEGVRKRFLLNTPLGAKPRSTTRASRLERDLIQVVSTEFHQEDIAAFVAALKTKGLCVVPNAGQGNCLFHGLEDQMGYQVRLLHYSQAFRR